MSTSLFTLVPDATLPCPPHMFFVCDLVLPINFENVSETYVYECLESSSCLGYPPRLRGSPVFVTLHVSELALSLLLY